MQEESYEKLIPILSTERLDAYRKMDQADEITTLARYLLNMAICESLYSPLQLFEVGLRNAIHNRLKCVYSDNWYENINFPLTNWGSEEIGKAKERIRKQKKFETPGLLVSELQFGFWTHLFEDHYESSTSFLPKSIKFLFPGLPKSEHNRKKLKRCFEEIRFLRNKVFHHERIIYWQDLSKKHQQILNVLNWINPELHEMAVELDRFADVYENGIAPWKEKIRTHWPKKNP